MSGYAEQTATAGRGGAEEERAQEERAEERHAAAAAPALRLGTRGSPLALRQAAIVAASIGEEVEIVVLRTAGDDGEGADKRRWVDTIEAALLEETVDLAVHSAKDLPAQLAPGLVIAGSPAQAAGSHPRTRRERAGRRGPSEARALRLEGDRRARPGRRAGHARDPGAGRR